jgi:RNA polymerase sigma factor (TIGR02999 family)
MEKDPDGEVTRLLLRWRAGDHDALTALLPLVYEELRRLARRHLSQERSSHTLQRTALVHEAFLRIVDSEKIDLESRAQFFGLASQVMRHVLVDHARSRSALKRGKQVSHIDIERVLRAEDDAVGKISGDMTPVPADDDIDFERVDDALKRLEKLDAQQGKLVELRFFGGLTIKEASDVMKISESTVKREWAIARAWLQRELTQAPTA